MKIHEDMAKEFAKEFAKALLADVQRVWDDIRRQYQEHGSLLSRQEMILHHLMSFPKHVDGGIHSGPSPRIETHHQDTSCGVCGAWRPPSQNGPQYQVQGGMRQAQLVGTGVGRSISSAEEDDMGNEARDLSEGKATDAADRSRFVIKKASQVERWVAEQLQGEASLSQGPISPQTFSPLTPARMSPRQAPPLAPKVPPPLRSPRIEDLGPLGVSFQRADVELNNLFDDARAPARLGSVAELHQAEFHLASKDAARESRTSESPLDNIPKKEGERVSRLSGIVGGRKSAVVRERRLFGDMGMDKNQLDQEDYRVEDFYHDTGAAQFIARSDWFQNVTLMVIGANAIYIGLDADLNNAEELAKALPVFIVFENLFCTFFTLEWCIRFASFRQKCDCLRDMWFKFDSALVLLMVVETWLLFFVGSGGIGLPTGLVKLLRLLRLARMARLVRMFPELVAMIKGVRQAGRAVGSALLLLILNLYVFAIIIYELLADYLRDNLHPVISIRFERLGTTMWTLLMDGTFMDNIGHISRALIEAKQWHVVSIFMVFVLGSALTVMNMLIGVLCEVVSAVKRAEEEDGQIRMVKDKLLYMLRDLDEDGSGQISKDEIQMVLHNQEALAVLENLNVDIQIFIEQLDMYFEAGEDLSIMQIMDLILVLRQDRQPTMKDILHQQAFLRWELIGDISQMMKMTLERTGSGVPSNCSSHNDQLVGSMGGTSRSTLTLGGASDRASSAVTPPPKRLSELITIKQKPNLAGQLSRLKLQGASRSSTDFLSHDKVLGKRLQ